MVCEQEYGLEPWDYGKQLREENRQFYTLDIRTGKCLDSENKTTDSLDTFSGIIVIPEFVTEQEQDELVQGLDQLPWDISQSGRRKQNFGPRANFKKRKAKVGSFRGFPRCTKFVQDRFASVPSLEGYRTVEQCSIEYRPDKGACIEPHIDDCWIWGERIVQLNLLSDSYLTCTPHNGSLEKYNLSDVGLYPSILSEDGNTVLLNPFQGKSHSAPYKFVHDFQDRNVAVKIPLPARSLLIMTGLARYQWEHAILREDVTSRRIVIAYRELTPPYLPGGGEQQLGQDILCQAEQFWEEQS